MQEIEYPRYPNNGGFSPKYYNLNDIWHRKPQNPFRNATLVTTNLKEEDGSTLLRDDGELVYGK